MKAKSEITEGGITIQHDASKVFYNPSQVLNRDLSIVAIRAYSILNKEDKEVRKARFLNEKGGTFVANEQFLDNSLTLLEPLGASGLRSLRYLKSLSELKLVVCNDLDPKAVTNCVGNRELNKELSGVDGEKLFATCCDADKLLSEGTSALLKVKQVDPNIALIMTEASRAYLDFNQDGTPIPETIFDKPFDIIDLDPYGTYIPFLDSALRKIKFGGMLCVTSVDMPVLGGQYPEVAFYRYGGAQLNKNGVPFIHELSLRLVVHSVQMTAAKYGLYVTPLACFSVDFYVRCFLHVRKSPSSNKYLGIESATSTHCPTCQATAYQPFGNFTVVDPSSKEIAKNTYGNRETAYESNTGNRFISPPHTEVEPGFAPLPCKYLPKIKFRIPNTSDALGDKCRYCDGESRPVICGPYYAGSLYQPRFLKVMSDILEASMEPEASKDKEQTKENVDDGEGVAVPNDHIIPELSLHKKLLGIIDVMRLEIKDVPLYYDQSKICSAFKIPMCPAVSFRNALKNLGYRVSVFHRDPSAIKTDAPSNVIHNIIRAWFTKVSEKETNITRLEYMTSFINKGFDLTVSFKRPAEEDGEACNDKKRARFLPNPAKNWGPMSKPRGNKLQTKVKNEEDDEEVPEAPSAVQ